jgi:hypothetical protein
LPPVPSIFSRCCFRKYSSGEFWGCSSPHCRKTGLGNSFKALDHSPVLGVCRFMLVTFSAINSHAQFYH